MKKFIKDFTLIIVLIFIIYLITKNKVVANDISFSVNIWSKNLFPNLFPFFVLSNVLIECNLIEPVNNIIYPLFKRLFKLPKVCCYVLLISIFSGYPSGAKYTSDLVNKNLISIDEANKLLTFTNYSNPLFVLGFIGDILTKKLSIIILISHILSGLIVGIIFNKNNVIINKNNSISKEKKELGKILESSIKDGLSTLIYLLGVIMIFLIISSFIKYLFHLNNNSYLVISSLLEMTQGIKNISLLNINVYIKTILITGIISFGGFSIHIQIKSLFSKIKYKYFLISRVIHSLISIILVSILILITY